MSDERLDAIEGYAKNGNWLTAPIFQSDMLELCRLARLGKCAEGLAEEAERVIKTRWPGGFQNERATDGLANALAAFHKAKGE